MVFAGFCCACCMLERELCSAKLPTVFQDGVLAFHTLLPMQVERRTFPLMPELTPILPSVSAATDAPTQDTHAHVHM